MGEEQTKIKKPGGLGGLMAIVIGIVLGVLLGYFYGKQMWLAGGGPEELLIQLEATKQQKEEFAVAKQESDLGQWEIAIRDESGRQLLADIVDQFAECFCPTLLQAVARIKP